ncbi:MAG: hypothetical protein ACHQQQ_15380 [Bacteroidota bacterium]
MHLFKDFPIGVKIVDTEGKIENFRKTIDELFEATECGGMVNIEYVEITKYIHET